MQTPSNAQYLSFHHLDVEEGLPSNATGHACFDSSGFVWIATNDGLISYDGNRIRQYVKETHSALPRNEIGFLSCDSRNRIWIGTNEGLAMMDEQRRIRRIKMHDSLQKKLIQFCFEVKSVGIIVISAPNTYWLPEGDTTWQQLSWFDTGIRKGSSIVNLRPFDGTKYMFVMKNRAIIVDFASKKIVCDIAAGSVSSVAKINDNELLLTKSDGFKLSRADIKTGKITREYTNIKDADGNDITATTVASSKAANGLIYISTRSGGLVAFDPVSEKFYTYRHEALNRSSISSDYLRWIFCHPNGDMLVTSSSGLNICNVSIASFRNQSNFLDTKDKIHDAGITGVAEDKNGWIWIKTFNDLLKWDTRTHSVKEILLPPPFESGPDVNAETGSITRDNTGNMWVTYNGKGVARFDANGSFIKFLSVEAGTLPTNEVRIIKPLPGKQLVVGGSDRIFLLHTETYKVDSLPNASSFFKGKRVVDIFPDGNKIWIAVSPGGGAYCYALTEKTLTSYTTENGLSSNRVYCLAKDSSNTMYIGTYDGLNILTPGKPIRVINKQNGLRHPRVDNIVTDKYGKVWITNFNSLIRYDPVKNSFSYFDERNGIRSSGFAVAANTITQDDKIIFCNSGLLMIDPEDVKQPEKNDPVVTVNRLFDDGGYMLLNTKETIRLAYNNSKISFYTLVRSLMSSNRVFYRYKLEGLDTGWQQSSKINQVTYNLRPGTYRFFIQASYNEGNWQDNENMITIIVSPPWWQTWWFITGAALLTAFIIYYLVRRRIKIIRSKAAISQQLSELEARAIRAQMNPHFIFNSLNAIQECIVTEKIDAAYDYLSSFSKLLRLVLDNSEKSLVPLSSEIEIINLQLSLESLRFNQSFSYSINVDESLDADYIQIPPLLLQPFVENAVWHGLSNKEAEKKLELRFFEKDNKLHCIIEDNGVGRAKAAEIKKQKMASHRFESKGMKMALQRAAILNKEQAGSAVIETTDLFDAQNNASGTRITVILSMYFSNPLKPGT